MPADQTLVPLAPAARNSGWRTAVNAVAFQVGWFACVLGAARNLALAGAAAGAVIVIWQTLLASRRMAEIQLIVAALVLGLLCDTLLAASGWIVYAASPLAPVAPLWILVLWALFASTLNVSLSWLQSRLGIAAALGLIAGPMSYSAGVRLGALHFAQPVQAVAALAVVWAVLTPLLAWTAARLSKPDAAGVAA